MKEDRKRAAIYARVSTSEQEKRQTVQIQLERLTKTIEERGWELVENYVDDGYSGELLERPALDLLLDEIEKKHIEVVLVTEPDRLARDFVAQKFLEKQINEKGAVVEFLSLSPPKSEDEQLGLDILGLVSWWERRKIRARTLRGKIKKAKEGHIVGGKAPYGYRYVGRTREKPGYYEILEEEAYWVRKIFHLYIFEGLSMEAIARYLTEKKVPTKSGNTVWRTSTIHSILTNRTYAGVAYYNKHHSIPPKDAGKTGHYRRLKNTSREIRPKEEWIPIKVPAIVDHEIWEEAQKKIKENTRTSPRNTRHPYLLRGKLVCGLCGLPLYGTPSGKRLFYYCSNRHRNSPLPKTCPAKPIDASILDCTVWESLSKALSHPDTLIAGLKKLQKTEANACDLRKQRLEEIERRLKKLEKAEQRAAELYTYDEKMTLQDYKKHVEKIRSEKERLKKEGEEIQKQMKMTNTLEEIEAQIGLLYNDITSKIETLSFDEKRKIVDLLVDKVVVTGNKVVIEGNIPLTNPPKHSSDNVCTASKSSLKSVQNNIKQYNLGILELKRILGCDEDFRVYLESA
ncbi:recombinase family protein [Candidatus Aerophobetes bacterium]|nr:recombinase family protein [Candidatus Aerophobetes bacterium]